MFNKKTFEVRTGEMASGGDLPDCECPICFHKFPQSDIERHVEACLSASSCGDVSGRTSDMDSNGSPSLDCQARKRTKFDIASWCGKSPKPVVTSTGRPSRHSLPFTSPDVTNSHDKEQDAAAVTSPARTASKRQPHGTRAPLAEQMRPNNLSEFVGQNQILEEKSILRTLIESHKIPSMILWGPPGCGKTSLANVIASHSRQFQDRKFVTLSATTAGVADVKEVIKVAKNDWSVFKRKTILFIDEIHRFNKLQQDTFLPFVENGTVTLIGATTENPSFSLNSALLSRCRVFVLEKLSVENIQSIVERTLKYLNIKSVASEQESELTDDNKFLCIEEEAVSVLTHLSDGDARIAISCLQLAVEAQKSKLEGGATGPITVRHIKDSLQRTHLLYDKKGDEHYNCISALHKSMRGSDGDASLYWLGRMLEGGEDPLYVARRLIRFASEDVGLADPLALNQAVATYQACHFIGMPECNVNLAQCVVYLAKAPKSTRIYEAYSKVNQCIKSHQGPLPGVPLHLRNAPTKLMKDLGYAKDYKYNPAFDEPVEQDYLPECLKGVKFLED